jgi:hypothetical protein
MPSICPGVCTCNADRYEDACRIRWKHDSGSLSNARTPSTRKKIVKTAVREDFLSVKLAR